MVENAVENDLYAVFMKLGADAGKIFLGAEANVDLTVVAGVVAVSVGLEDRRKIYRVYAETL